MKKLLFAAYSLDVGGIEKALVTLTNYLQKQGYDITIVLEKKQGEFLNDLNKKIKVIEYRPNENKNIIKRKIINLIKRVRFIIKYKNKFDFSASFATYSIAASFISRVASKNSCLWVHTDYLVLYDNDIEQIKKFFNERKYKKFRNIAIVSKEAKKNFVKIFPDVKERCFQCNNLVDYKKIQELSNFDVNVEKNRDTTLFVNVSRHEEKAKKITRIIEAAEKLKNDKLKFKILLVGEGESTEKYKEMVRKKKLESNIIFLGQKQNPYPYLKKADCVILTSEYEGYPVVFLESFVLNKPLITTKVSDYQEVENGRGYVTEKDVDDIYDKMKLFIKKGYKIENKFDGNKYNEKIFKKIKKIIEEK